MKKLLIVTDLDASFIDENYQFSEALEAVEKMKALGFPLVFNSSKTLAELKSLAEELQLTTPLIAENGGIIAVPLDSEVSELCELSEQQAWKTQGEYKTLITGLSREYILEQAHQAREEHGYAFEGFDDWSDEELSAKTGLSLSEASMAKQRDVSEPILWQDSEERWETFSSFLKSKGIRALRGGRFIHLMGYADKADGLNVTRRLYENRFPEAQWISVAIGDSANDQSMLESADIAIVIPHSDGFKIQVQAPQVIQAKHPASKGWNDAVLDLISSLYLI
ncbi:MAG: HAD-IIB family hydrolase [Akkermansiaceae bacterium]